LPIESWRDVDLADKTARRNACLDDKAHGIRVGLALIDARIQACDLPKDSPENAPEGLPKSDPLQNGSL
jgi:hypothetical protein